MFVKCGEIVIGKKLFERMPMKYVVLWSKNYGRVKSCVFQGGIKDFC